MTRPFPFFVVMAVVFGPLSVHAQTPAVSPTNRVPPSVSATRVQAPPVLDGHLDDAAWSAAPPITVFTQLDPKEGTPASEPTDVRIVYDAEAIYIGARLSDSGGVTSRLGRRDMPTASSDWFRVSFDTYHDRRIGVRFDVNPAGVRRDAAIGASGGGGGGGGGGGRGGGGGGSIGGPDGDLAWDAVWDAATSVDSGGWTAELKIPFNQLRFSRGNNLVWGLQLERIIARNQEYSLFSFRPKSEPGGVPAFGDLQGLNGIQPGRPMELVPYVVSEGQFTPPSTNTLQDSRDLTGNVGFDARYRLTSNMALTGTVNPDFGQVEVDPAVINLTAFETRYEERRPFFVEGASNFQFGGNIRGPGASAASLLYSRRIGRSPQLRLPSGDTDVPGVTDILGAVKVSGRTSTGWSVGLLNAVTNDEHGRYIDGNGTVQRDLVEPRTNYLVGRLNREFRRGQSTIGGMFTSVNRDLADPDAAASLRGSAYAGGVDFVHEWANRSWALGGFFAGSRVAGSSTAIEATQRSSGRYYQRPDSRTLSVDPTATSLGGYATSVQIRKDSGRHWTGDFWVSATSPGFEINDVGFLQRTDRIATGGALRYNERIPGRVFREWNASIVQNHTVNYDGDWIEKILRFSGGVTFLNYWSVNANGTWERERFDDRFTRGGPLAIKPPSWSARLSVNSDPRNAVTINMGVDTARDTVGSQSNGASVSLNVRTSPRWNLSFGPDLTRAKLDAQYVGAVSDPLMTDTYGRRYIFSTLNQTELSLVTRLNYTFTPDLTFELYLQPLVSNGEYGTPRQFQAPSTYSFATYGTDIGTLTREDGTYTIDPDGPGAAPAFTISDRSFTTRSVRANAVLRWEYRPGSTLYLVWQQERLNPALMDDFRVGRALGSLFAADSNNVLVLKWTYRFNP